MFVYEDECGLKWTETGEIRKPKFRECYFIERFGMEQIHCNILDKCDFNDCMILKEYKGGN